MQTGYASFLAKMFEKYFPGGGLKACICLTVDEHPQLVQEKASQAKNPILFYYLYHRNDIV